jgi:hypothetical protein
MEWSGQGGGLLGEKGPLTWILRVPGAAMPESCCKGISNPHLKIEI